MIDLSTSGLHVGVLLGGLRAVDHHLILGAWPSLLIVTDRVSLQLDPARWLDRSQAADMSGRLLREVTRWDASIRDDGAIRYAQRSGLPAGRHARREGIPTHLVARQSPGLTGE